MYHPQFKLTVYEILSFTRPLIKGYMCWYLRRAKKYMQEKYIFFQECLSLQKSFSSNLSKKKQKHNGLKEGKSSLFFPFLCLEQHMKWVAFYMKQATPPQK